MSAAGNQLPRAGEVYSRRVWILKQRHGPAYVQERRGSAIIYTADPADARRFADKATIEAYVGEDNLRALVTVPARERLEFGQPQRLTQGEEREIESPLPQKKKKGAKRTAVTTPAGPLADPKPKTSTM